MKPSEKKRIFSWKVVPRERIRFGIYSQCFFVKCTNQRKFVRFCLMLQSEEETVVNIVLKEGIVTMSVVSVYESKEK